MAGAAGQAVLKGGFKLITRAILNEAKDEAVDTAARIAIEGTTGVDPLFIPGIGGRKKAAGDGSSPADASPGNPHVSSRTSRDSMNEATVSPPRTSKESPEPVGAETPNSSSANNSRTANPAPAGASSANASSGAGETAGSNGAASYPTASVAPTKATLADMRTPKPNTLYESNGYLYRTDSGGRLAEVSGDLRLSKAPRNSYQQGKVARSSGVAGDEGGHMIGSQFDGLGEGPLQMVPQSMKLNRGSGSKWAAMEREWANALARGDKVKVKIDVDWPSSGATRPDAFRVKYEITDAATGTVTPANRTFLNK